MDDILENPLSDPQVVPERPAVLAELEELTNF